MRMVINEGFRGLSLIMDISRDRVLVPVAMIAALCGAVVLGVELADMFAMDPSVFHQL